MSFSPFTHEDHGARCQGPEGLGAVERERLDRPAGQILGAIREFPGEFLLALGQVDADMDGVNSAVLGADLVADRWDTRGVRSHAPVAQMEVPRIARNIGTLTQVTRGGRGHG